MDVSISPDQNRMWDIGLCLTHSIKPPKAAARVRSIANVGHVGLVGDAADEDLGELLLLGALPGQHGGSLVHGVHDIGQDGPVVFAVGRAFDQAVRIDC